MNITVLKTLLHRFNAILVVEQRSTMHKSNYGGKVKHQAGRSISANILTDLEEKTYIDTERRS